MPVKIMKDTTEDPLIDAELLIQTIEKNRDRLRLTAGMIMNLAAISISASLAIAFFLLKEPIGNKHGIILIIIALALLFVGIFLAIEAGHFREDYNITTRSQFIADLLKLFARERQYIRLASMVTFIGLGLLALAVLLQVVPQQ